MNDNVDQLLHCARLAGVSPSILIDGVEQIRAVARRRLTECSPKTAIQVLKENADAQLSPGAVPDAECGSAEFVLSRQTQSHVGDRPSVTLTLQGSMYDVNQFMQALYAAVKDAQPLQPMLDLLRGAKGKPLHIVCQLSEDGIAGDEESDETTSSANALGGSGAGKSLLKTSDDSPTFH